MTRTMLRLEQKQETSWIKVS